MRIALCRFKFERTLQASAYLLRLDRKKMSYLRLLKLLYIADREWLAENGESITGDRAYAMKQGPVLSTVYDLIKGNGSKAGEWDDFIHTDGYAVELVADPGRGELSRSIVEKLGEVTERYRNIDDWELSEQTHELKEWADHFKGSATPDSLAGSSPCPGQAGHDCDRRARRGGSPGFRRRLRTRVMKAGDTFYIRPFCPRWCSS